MLRRGLSTALLSAVLGMPVGVAALAGQSGTESSRATWNVNGIAVRFPAELAPHRLAVDTVVGDHFSGLEWRVVLEGESTVYLSAFVIPPDRHTLALHAYDNIEDALNAGGAHLRRCDKDYLGFRCALPASALVRPVGGELEIVITDYRWLSLAAQSRSPVVHLGVRRMGVDIWSAVYPLTLADQ